MKTISDRISYIEAAREPLSADIGIVRDENDTWLYDVGNGDEPITELDRSYNVVLSHFHPDHIGNLAKLNVKELYLSKETLRHIPRELQEKLSIHVVTKLVTIGELNIFPIPSSHAKGSLGLEIDGTYTFVGDALYCKASKNGYVYNVQFLKEEIETIRNLSSPYLLVSHFPGLIRKKEEVLEELEAIYARREKGMNEIPIS